MPRTRVRTRPSRVVALLTAALLVVSLPVVVPSVAVAAPTDQVTLVGSLQSELGCAGDWDPACASTQLTWNAATGRNEAAFDVPAGSFAYKITIGGNWDESYGAGGVKDGPDIPLKLEGPDRLTFAYDPGTHLVAVTTGTSLTEQEERGLSGTSLRKDLTREQFYFVMTDRFANADPGNDAGGLTGDPLVTGLNPADKGFYHGGDIKGITAKLDYLKGLGTTAIWMTPSFKNRPVQGTGANASAGYHGYWITDFTQIDPHLGTNDDLKDLIAKAHAKGMKVFFDIITNHTADVVDFRQQRYGYISKEDSPYKDDQGVEFDDRDYIDSPDFPPLDPAVSFPYTPYWPTAADETVKVPAAFNDLTFYHNRGDSTFAGESSEYGDFVGLDDLFTEQPAVRDALIEAYSYWAKFGVDGFRIDTVKHVNMEFWQAFSPAMRNAAASVGNRDFFMFGEIFDANPAFMSQYTTTGTLQAALDFGFQSVATQFGQGKPTSALRDLLLNDDYYTDADSNAYQSPTFLGNHDMGRIGNFLSQGGTVTGDELLNRDRLTHSLMYLTRGQPVVYYGDEQGFVGDGGDKDARQDMFPSQVESYNDDDLIGTDATTAVDNFDRSHPLYKQIAALSKLRKDNPALADGAQIHRYASNKPGIYAFSRIDAKQQIEYIVAANNTNEPQTATFDTFTADARYNGLWPAGTPALRSDDEGRVTVTVPALSVHVFKATDRLKRTQDRTAPAFISQVAGGTVGGRAEIRSVVPAGGFDQVSYAWRPAGTTAWHQLGTDDNAPYRVFHDVTGLANGTVVEYAAIRTNSSGGRSSTVAVAVVGDPPAPPSGGGAPVVQPDSVTVAGSLNSEMGCPGDWLPECEQAMLAIDPDDDVWKGTWTLPANSYAYKAALNGNWDENYGAGAVRGGADISIEIPDNTPVTWYYDRRTNWITTDLQNPIITVPGNHQSELGCPADWSPDCMLPWLQDPDGDGTYTLTLGGIPEGSYAAKVAHGLSWDENYGAGGAPGGADIPFEVKAGAVVTFSYELASHVLTITSNAAGTVPDLTARRGQWLDRGTVAWDLPAGAEHYTYRLYSAKNGGLELDVETILGGTSIPLTHAGTDLPAELAAKWPHLAFYDVLALSRHDAKDRKLLSELLKGQLAIAAFDDTGALVDATGVQIPAVLDDLYSGAPKRTLGVTFSNGAPSFAVWAPTAHSVSLKVDPVGSAPEKLVSMKRDDDGVWAVKGGRDLAGAQYQFVVTVYVPSTGDVKANDVTDPYSVALTTNSVWSVAADLNSPSLVPAGWSHLKKPNLEQFDDSTIYELHVRDFSIGDSSVPAAQRGTYLGFTDRRTNGMKHLKELADAGLNTVHLLPSFDIATIPENRADQQTPACDLTSFAPDSEEQQACVDPIRDTDGFNWGYDPLHYTTPEGSYATNPDGPQRTKEYRQMVAGLNGIGLRVVLDVVYNHTAASGQDPKSVLDRVVPGYYQRLNATGAQETSTCCANTATEHAMMEKLMIDSLVTWAKQYKVDGFRFDLMGHHSKQNLLNVRKALDQLTLRKDGVDGKKIFLYGEGWNFGEVADNARFVQATQANMAGTGIATFSDRLRDAVRGGGPFDDDPGIQGFGTGLFTAPNASPNNGDARARLLQYEDLIKVGLAGNMKDFEFLSSVTGGSTTGAQVDYNGSPAGYTADPSEVITYVDAHDNETLFDASVLKLRTDTADANRVRWNTVSLATTALSQGPMLWHAGNDLLRSKSLDRNSYNSGDWFNRIDWTGQENTFGSGLPPRGDNESKWPYMQPLLEFGTKPPPSGMADATAAAQDLLELRFSSPLFRLGSAQAIQQKVSFGEAASGQVPGLIVMTIDDTLGKDVDRRLRKILVVFNATPQPQTVSGAGGLTLSPIQANGSDPVVKKVAVSGDTVTVPALTVAVLQV